MTTQNKTTLKGYFETGDTITQAALEDLIDSSVIDNGTVDTVPWTLRLKADDLTGSDGAAVTTWTKKAGTAATPTGTGTLRTAGNGINSKKVIRFDGTSNLFTATTGSEALTSSWYMAAVYKPISLSGARTVICWGEEADGKRRMLATVSTKPWFVGYNVDLEPPLSSSIVSTGTAYLFEVFRNPAGVVQLFVNGEKFAEGTLSLVAYTGTAIKIGSNNANGEFASGDIAEIFIAPRTITTAEQVSLRAYITSEYGITCRSALQVREGYLASIDSAGGNGGSIVKCDPAGIFVDGRFEARTTADDREHRITSNQPSSSGFGRNVLRLQQLNATGYSCVYGVGHDVSESQNEGYGFAVGWGNTSGGAIPSTNVAYFESFNALSTTYKQYAVIQTNSTGQRNRYICDPVGNIIEYSLGAAYPNEKQVSVRGLLPTATANAAVLTTVIQTPAYGLLIVRDDTNAKVAVYAIQSTTLTAINADAQFSTTKDTASKVNVYAESNVIKVQNNSGGSLNLTAAYYGA